MTMIAEAARERGHDVTQHDLLHADSQTEGVVEAVRSCQPDVIGLSLRNIDNIDSAGLVAYSHAYAEVGRILRASTTAPIVLGGAGYSLFPELLLDKIGAQYGITGEGEVAFCQLVEELAGGATPEASILRGEHPVMGDAIAAPARDTQLASFYLKEGGMLNLQSKRGCPHRCAYCTYPLLEGDTYRFRPPAAVVDEVEMLTTRFGAEYLAFTDSVFNDGRGQYLAIAEELTRRENQVPWMAFFRPQHFDRSEVDLLKRAGLHAVEWGTDCTTDATLAGMHKDFAWGQVETSNRVFAEAGIRNAHFVIFGGPGETEQTVREGLANLDRLANCVVFAFCGVRILPGTAIQGLAVEQGLVERTDPLMPARFYFSPEVGGCEKGFSHQRANGLSHQRANRLSHQRANGFSHERLQQTVTRSFSGRMDRIYPMGDEIERVRAFHRLGYRGPIWDLLLEGGSRRRRDRRRHAR
jgi:hypothetical protein